ncbi:CD209 antigen-like protein C isoform X1 [Huso huso]|uniref:CD209 antigen-like protein C isoform X1 n=1 Tax=Huso huso TaxID=61971 RepID=A0ABR0YXT6_HUSHU
MDGIYNGLQNPSEDVYSTVNQPQGKRAGVQQGDPTAGKAPYRQAALVLAGLCALSVAKIIFLTVYSEYCATRHVQIIHNTAVCTIQRHHLPMVLMSHLLHIAVSNFRTKNLELQSQYSELKGTSPTSLPLRVCKACPQNWELFNGKCYYFSTDRMNWTSSRDNCTSLGGHLVIIDLFTVQRSLSDKALIITQAYRYEEKSYWIGLTDAVTEGTWLWVDGTPLIGNVQAKFWVTRSDGKQPDDYKGEDPSGEDCAQLQPQRNSYETWEQQVNGWLSV